MRAMKAKTVVITGVSGGLGRAMALGFAEAGHRVLGCGRRATELAKLSESIAGERHFSEVDISEDSEVESWAKEIANLYPPADILINNAAIVNANAPLWQVPAEEFEKLIRINIIGTNNTIRHFLPPMLARKSGVVVNFSSGWGRSTSPEVVPYCASKWAIEGLSQGLAQELPSPMACVAFNPGIINTDMLNTSFGSAAKSYPSPEEWAKSAVPRILKISRKDNGRSL